MNSPEPNSYLDELSESYPDPFSPLAEDPNSDKDWESIDAMDRMLALDSPNPYQRFKMRERVAGVGNPDRILSFFGHCRIRRFFELLSGSGKEYPYAFVLPLYDSDLRSYLEFELIKGDPADQAQSAFDYIDEPIERAGTNLLVSYLKANPGFTLRVFSSPKLYNNTVRDSALSSFLGKVRDDIRLDKGFEALSYYFTNPERIELIAKYRTAVAEIISGRQRANVAKVAWRIQDKDYRFLEKLLRD
jgi:hypothetical protein